VATFAVSDGSWSAFGLRYGGVGYANKVGKKMTTWRGLPADDADRGRRRPLHETYGVGTMSLSCSSPSVVRCVRYLGLLLWCLAALIAT